MYDLGEWVSIEDHSPMERQTVLTIGVNDDGNWTTPITATYYEGKFLVVYSFNSDRIINICIETKPTMWFDLRKIKAKLNK